MSLSEILNLLNAAFAKLPADLSKKGTLMLDPLLPYTQPAYEPGLPLDLLDEVIHNLKALKCPEVENGIDLLERYRSEYAQQHAHLTIPHDLTIIIRGGQSTRVTCWISPDEAKRIEDNAGEVIAGIPDLEDLAMRAKCETVKQASEHCRHIGIPFCMKEMETLLEQAVILV